MEGNGFKLFSGTMMGPYKNRADWLKARRGGLGGSDVGAILGMSTYTSALEVYYSKLEDAPEKASNEAMDIGQAIEGWILHQWIERQDSYPRVRDDLVIIQSNNLPFLLHSPDALLLDYSGTYVEAGIEIKNVRSDAAWDPIPEPYYAQVQHGLLCSGLDRWIVVALVAGQKLIVREIEPDREMMGRIALEGDRFWREHVMAGVPPAPDGSESAGSVLRNRWQVTEDEVATIPGPMWEDYRRLDSAVKALTTQKDSVAQKMQALMGPKEYAQVVHADGTTERVASWKPSTRKIIDTTRMKEEAPDVAEKYQKVTTTRTFRPKS